MLSFFKLEKFKSMLTSYDNNSRETRYNIQKYSNGERLILLNVTESHTFMRYSRSNYGRDGKSPNAFSTFVRKIETRIYWTEREIRHWL